MDWYRSAPPERWCKAAGARFLFLPLRAEEIVATGASMATWQLLAGMEEGVPNQAKLPWNKKQQRRRTSRTYARSGAKRGKRKWVCRRAPRQSTLKGDS